MCEWFANRVRWNFRWNHFSWARWSWCTVDARWRCFSAVADVSLAVRSFSRSCYCRHKPVRDRRIAVGDDDGFAGASCNAAGSPPESSASGNCRWSCFHLLARAVDVPQAADVGGRLWTSLAVVAALHRCQRVVGEWGAVGEVLDINTICGGSW